MERGSVEESRWSTLGGLVLRTAEALRLPRFSFFVFYIGAMLTLIRLRS